MEIVHLKRGFDRRREPLLPHTSMRLANKIKSNNLMGLRA